MKPATFAYEQLTVTDAEQKRLAHTAILRACDRVGGTWDEAREIAEMLGLIEPTDEEEPRPHLKLDQAKARRMRELAAEGHGHQGIADEFGCSRSTVSAVIQGRAWRT